MEYLGTNAKDIIDNYEHKFNRTKIIHISCGLCPYMGINGCSSCEENKRDHKHNKNVDRLLAYDKIINLADKRRSGYL